MRGAVLEPSGAVLEPAAAVLKHKGVLEPAGISLKPTSAAVEPTRAVLETTTATSLIKKYRFSRSTFVQSPTSQTNSGLSPNWSQLVGISARRPFRFASLAQLVGSMPNWSDILPTSRKVDQTFS